MGISALVALTADVSIGQRLGRISPVVAIFFRRGLGALLIAIPALHPAAVGAQDSTNQLAITGTQVVSSTRANRTEFDYILKATVANSGDTAALQVSAQVTSSQLGDQDHRWVGHLQHRWGGRSGEQHRYRHDPPRSNQAL